MRTLLAVLALAAPLGTARAAAGDFWLTIHGSGFHQYNAWECPPTLQCPAPGFGLGWSGTVEVQTASTADGFYSGSDVLGVHVRSFTNGAERTLDFDATGESWSYVEPYEMWSLHPPTVTIGDGKVAAFDFGAYLDEYISVTFSGLNARYTWGCQHHCGREVIDATLIPATPEPATYALMMVGLAACAAATRRTRRSRPAR